VRVQCNARQSVRSTPPSPACVCAQWRQRAKEKGGKSKHCEGEVKRGEVGR